MWTQLVFGRLAREMAHEVNFFEGGPNLGPGLVPGLLRSGKPLRPRSEQNQNVLILEDLMWRGGVY